MSNLKNYISRMHKLYSRKKEAPYTLKLLYSLTSKLDQENLELTLDKIEALMIGEEEEHFLRSIIKEISNLLGEGESLIITERFTPNFGASTVIPLGSTSFSAKVSAKVDHTWIKRMQIRRKDSKTIQIFDDRGKGLGFNFSFDIKNRIPILRFNRENKNGQYKVKSYTLNVQANTDLNPHFYKNIAHLNTILSTGSTAALSKEQSPATIRGDFRDTYNRINFLFLKRRRLKGYTEYKLEAFGKLKGDYVSYRDTINTGKDWELFFRDVANYFITKISPDLSLETNLWQNPGQALLGTGKTRTADYEARKTPQGLDLEFIKVGMRYQGWSKKVKGIKKVALKINKSFKQELFSQSHFIQLDKMSLYDIKAHLSIYQSGVDRLKAMTKDQLIKYAFHREYKDLKKCSDYVNLRTLSDGSKIPSCGHMDTALHLLNKCQRLDRLGKKLKRRLKCWTRYASELFNRLDINVLVGILGQDNIYISGEINGFLKNSEHLRKPIRSNTFGRKHPKYPNGPLKVIETKLGINTGELEGYWMRDRL